MRKFFIAFVLIFIATESFGGNESNSAGAAGAGMAHASVCNKDVWGAFNNQAALGFTNELSLGLYNEFRYGMKELSFNAFAFAMPIKEVGTFSLATSYYGYKQYNEQLIGIAYSRKFGDNFSAGLQVDYLAANFADEYYGNKSAFVVEASILTMLTKELSLGLHIFNPTRSSFSEYDDERIPTTIQLGMNYDFNPKVKAAIEAEYVSDEKTKMKLGFEYHVINPFYIRAGVAFNNTAGYLGFGLALKQLQIDFAASMHQVLGFTPHTSITLKF